MIDDQSLLPLLTAREFSSIVRPLKSSYPQIKIYSLDLSVQFSFPGAREIVYIAVSPPQVLDEHVSDIIEERVSAYGFRDRPIVLEFTQAKPEALALLSANLGSVAFLDRAEIASLLVRHESLKGFLRKLFVASFSLRTLNPYIFRGPVIGRQFFGREDEIASLRSQVQRSYVISGVRRSGKTSLLLEVKQRIESAPGNEEVIVYATFENCGSIEDVPRTLLRSLPGAGDNYTKLANSDRWRFPQNLPRLMEPLSRYLEKCREQYRVVRFFLDEYDRVLSLERDQHRSGLTGVFRELLVEQVQRQRQVRRGEGMFNVQFAFSGSPLLYDELLSKRSPVYNFATKLQLRNFELKTLTNLLVLPLRDLGLKIENAALLAQRMLEITGGHPSTSQHLCSRLVDQLDPSSREVTIKDLSEAGQDPDFIGELADTIERNISPLGRFILSLIAQSQREFFQVDHFRRGAEAHGIRLNATATTLALAALTDSGYVTSVPTDHRTDFRLAIPTVRQIYADIELQELIPDMLEEGQCSPLSIPVFVAIEFHTDLHRHLERTFKRHQPVLAARFLEFETGTIYDHLVGAMDAGDPLTLVDISKINNNVCFELGLAIGLNRPGFPIVETNHQISPDLLRGLFRVGYRLGRRFDDSFLSAIKTTWDSYQRRQEDRDFIHMLGWLYKTRSALASPYIVVIGHDELNDAGLFRRAVNASVRKVGVKMRHIWDSDRNLLIPPEVGTDTILPAVYTLLRQASAVVVRVEDIRSDERASHFIAIGIAKGIEERYGEPKLLMCHRQRSAEGRNLDIPSNLAGLRNITDFDPRRPQRLAGKLEALFQSVVQNQGDQR